MGGATPGTRRRGGGLPSNGTGGANGRGGGADELLSIQTAAARVGFTAKTIRNLLSRYRAAFVPVYEPGAPGQRRRLLSESDVARLAQLVAGEREGRRAVERALRGGPAA